MFLLVLRYIYENIIFIQYNSCSKKLCSEFLVISSFRLYGDFFDDCNIFLNLLSELLLIIKIPKIRTKPITILKLTSLGRVHNLPRGRAMVIFNF